MIVIPIQTKLLSAEEAVAVKKIMFSIFLLCLPIIAVAYDGSPEEQVGAFFKEFSSGKSNEAIENLYSSNPAFGEKLQQLTVLKQQITMVSALYGKPIGQETFATEKPTPSITRIVVVDKHEKHPVIWEFYFYKPYDKWIISQGILNDQFGFLSIKK
jgi:hypothetical protein